jgi:hypothetical protein
VSREYIDTACRLALHERCDDLACMCECHFPNIDGQEAAHVPPAGR